MKNLPEQKHSLQKEEVIASRQRTIEKASVHPERREAYMFNSEHNSLYLVLHHSILHELLFYCLLGGMSISFTGVQPHQNLQSSNGITLAESGPLSVNCLSKLSPESESHDINILKLDALLLWLCPRECLSGHGHAIGLH